MDEDEDEDSENKIGNINASERGSLNVWYLYVEAGWIMFNSRKLL